VGPSPPGTRPTPVLPSRASTHPFNLFTRCPPSCLLHIRSIFSPRSCPRLPFTQIQSSHHAADVACLSRKFNPLTTLRPSLASSHKFKPLTTLLPSLALHTNSILSPGARSLVSLTTIQSSHHAPAVACLFTSIQSSQQVPADLRHSHPFNLLTRFLPSLASSRPPQSYPSLPPIVLPRRRGDRLAFTSGRILRSHSQSSLATSGRPFHG
jgi:hypothetical protein